jgi:hypothetical protein
MDDFLTFIAYVVAYVLAAAVSLAYIGAATEVVKWVWF